MKEDDSIYSLSHHFKLCNDKRKHFEISRMTGARDEIFRDTGRAVKKLCLRRYGNGISRNYMFLMGS